MKLDKRGFTLIEILMVVLLLAILATVGLTQFKDFSSNTRVSVTKENLGIMRSAISHQYSQMRLRCNETGTAWPAVATITANDIKAAAPCSGVAEVSASDAKFVQGGIPANALGPNQSNTVTACAGGCARTTDCAGGAFDATDDGWCYNPATGDFWANTNNQGANNF